MISHALWQYTADLSPIAYDHGEPRATGKTSEQHTDYVATSELL